MNLLGTIFDLVGLPDADGSVGVVLGAMKLGLPITLSFVGAVLRDAGAVLVGGGGAEVAALLRDGAEVAAAALLGGGGGVEVAAAALRGGGGAGVVVVEEEVPCISLFSYKNMN